MANSKISVENLNLHYGENHALKDVNMEIADHAITAFIGPSGCGKSTFLRCLNRMNDLVDGCRVEGKVILDGEDIYDKRVDTTLLRKKVGMVFQQPNPFPMSIYDNIAYGPRLHGIKNKKELDEIDAEQAYKKNFPPSFADAFDMLMKKNGDTRETIAEKLNVNCKSLQRWLKEPDRRINADFIVLLALTWRLPDWISALLLDRAYIQLSESNRRHLALQYILKVLWSEGIENANAYLTARKLDCLSI